MGNPPAHPRTRVDLLSGFNLLEFELSGFFEAAFSSSLLQS
jgi:hypothetical protein